jgi:dienelactone hydrolase
MREKRDTRLEDFDVGEFSHDGVSRPVYRGGTGPGVVLMHEIPGLTPHVLYLGKRIIEAGFTVVMPDLFGKAGKQFSNIYSVSSIFRTCIRKEFWVLSTRGSSPVTTWLRALCKQVHEELGGPGVGAVGLCMTGNFALALAVDPWLMAPVLAQPSLPFPLGKKRKAAIHLSEQDTKQVQHRCQKEQLSILGMRFTNDLLCPSERFLTLNNLFGSQFEAIEIDSSRGNSHEFSFASHSVVGVDLIDQPGNPTHEALERMLSFFHERLDSPVT